VFSKAAGYYPVIFICMDTEKKFYQRWWFWSCVTLVLIVLISAGNSNTNNSTSTVPANTTSTATNEPSSPVPVHTEAAPEQIVKAKTPTPAPTPTPVTPASWHTVATFSGGGDTKTDTFAIQGSKWRIDWTITPAAGAESYCEQHTCSANFQIFQDDGTYVDQFMGTGQIATNGTSYEYNKTGNFHIGVVQGNVSWSLTVEDYY